MSEQEFDSVDYEFAKARRITAQVEDILSNPKYSERAKNDDEYLIWAWGIEYANLPFLEYELYKKLKKIIAKADYIKRIRRKLNEKGLYLPSDLTVLRRRKREVKMREVMTRT